MAWKVSRGARYAADIDAFGRWCSAYDEEFAARQFDEVDRAIRGVIATAPLSWAYFIHTGAPYRAYLYRMGRRTSFWIVYAVDERSRTIRLLRFWNAARDPRRFRI